MRRITFEEIEKVWEWFAELQTEGAEKMIETMQHEQPMVLVYLLSSGEDLEEHEHDDLLFLGLLVWKIFRSVQKDLPLVTSEMIEAYGEANSDMIGRLSEESEGDFVISAESIFKSYNQNDVLGVVVEEIISSDELSEVAKGYMLIVLKTLIDCFDQ